MKVAAGEAVASRIVFEQLLRAEAIDVLQIDAARVAGGNERFAEPARVVDGNYVAPEVPGIGAHMHEDSLATWEFPEGAGWQQQSRTGPKNTYQEEVQR